MTIIAGFRAAATVAEASLSSGAIDHAKESPQAFRDSLLRVARTTLSSKILTNDRDHFAELAVDAVLRLQRPEDGVSPPALDAIHVLKKAGGALGDSFLDEGFILDKAIGVGQPKKVVDAKILVANTAMDTDKVKIYGARVRVDSMAKVAELEAAERQKMRSKVEKIVAHGVNAFVNRQLIYNFPEELFADAGVLAVEHADFDGIEVRGEEEVWSLVGKGKEREGERTKKKLTLQKKIKKKNSSNSASPRPPEGRSPPPSTTRAASASATAT